MTIRKIVSRSIGTDVIAAEDLAANSVTVAEISDGAVTEAKIGSGAVTGAKIGDGEVSEGKIASGAVTGAKIGDGEVSGAKLASTAVTDSVGQIGGRRNLIINGAMQVAQRGTSSGSSTSDGIYSLDRWYVNSSGGTYTLSQQSFTVGQTDVPNFPKNYMRFAASTGNNNLGLHQRVEDVETLGGKTVTLSFWAKGTNPDGGVFVSSWIQNFGSGGSTGVETEAEGNIVLTSSWQKFTITFNVPSISGKTVGAGSFTWVEILRQPSTDTGTGAWTADIAQVQLEVGDTATPFEHRSYGEELALCQRYYEVLGGEAYKPVGYGIGRSATKTLVTVRYKVQKRAAPSVTVSTDLIITPRTEYDTPVISTAGFYINDNGAQFECNHASEGAQYRPHFLQSNSVSPFGTFEADAEL